MIESVFDIAAVGYPGPEISFSDADLADWIEQQQTVPLPDDDYPHQSSRAQAIAELVAVGVRRYG
jgi:hypothetical protein